jgi:SAM-dependent methyltransferase
MAKRYALTMKFIDQYVRAGVVVADIGCGTGIFTVEMLRRGAQVRAIDISESALSLTRSMVQSLVPEHARNVEFFQLDASRQGLPNSDVALAMGITPYMENLEPFYDNILPNTKVFYCLVLDPRHWANVVRTLLPVLNVRSIRCFERRTVSALLAKHNWKLIERRGFASGYLDLAIGPNIEAACDAGLTS